MASSFDSTERRWLIAGSVGLLVFLAALASVLAHGGITAWDAPVAARVAWVPLAFGATLDVLGGTLVVALAVGAGSLFLAWRRRWWGVARLAGLVLAGEALVQILKRVIARPRPLNPYESGFSFPSGHATNAAILACLLVWFALRARRGRSMVVALVIVALAWAIGIALSRVVYGVHYASDVIGGAGLGLFVGGAGLALLSVAERRFTQRA